MTKMSHSYIVTIFKHLGGEDPQHQCCLRMGDTHIDQLKTHFCKMH